MQLQVHRNESDKYKKKFKKLRRKQLFHLDILQSRPPPMLIIQAEALWLPLLPTGACLFCAR